MELYKLTISGVVSFTDDDAHIRDLLLGLRGTYTERLETAIHVIGEEAKERYVSLTPSKVVMVKEVTNDSSHT